MNEEELIRKLNSVGKTIFVEYFSIFQEYATGQMSREDCIETLVSNDVSNESGASIRCGNAKQIFNANMENTALTIISESKRLPYDTVSRAAELIG